MISKIYIFIIFFGISVILNNTTAQTVECRYGTSWFKIVSKTKYSCFILNTNNDLKPTAIEGEHTSGKSDDDVEILDIKSGNLMNHFSSIYCNKFQNLVSISANDARIKSIDENALFSCPDLINLLMPRNRLGSLPQNLLSHQSKLKHVNLFDNLLTTLPENFFINQSELERIDLSNNQIDFLPNDLFQPLKKLMHLSLNGNQIREVPDGLFKNLKNLEVLSLERNNITTLDSDNFEGLDSITIINMDGNQISDLPPRIFTPLINIEVLSLEGNRLNVIHSDSFGTHDKITFFRLSNNRIKALDERIFESKNLKWVTFRNNICADLQTFSEIKSKLKECFTNYQSRSQHVVTSSSKSSGSSCGRSIAGHANIIGGTEISKGTFPWMGVLASSNGTFICGCTLISDMKVITAAQCIHEKKTRQNKYPSLKQSKDLIVLLGVNDLDNPFEIGRTISAVKSTHMHDDWNPFTVSFDADIAVLVLDSPVAFNKNIQPICLIPPGSNILTISQSIAVSFRNIEEKSEELPMEARHYGVHSEYDDLRDFDYSSEFNENSESAEIENIQKVRKSIPKVLENPIHLSEICFVHSPHLNKIASGRTFCAGLGNGQGMCKRDVGNGAFVSQNGKYYLRGFVSFSLFNGPYDCDMNNYAIFTDVTKFYDWINSIPIEESPEFRHKISKYGNGH